MSPLGVTILERYEQRLRVDLRRSALAEFLREERIHEPEVLADLIERDGRARLDCSMPISLDDYLAAVPSIRDNHVALDAAIDMALRSLSGGSRPTEHAVRELILKHPELETQIRESAALGLAIWTTDELQVNQSRESLRLPFDVGPAISDGTRRYTLIEAAGRGAFGDVFKARDNMLSDPDKPAWVAVKMFSGSLTSEAEKWRFTDEATKARRVSHESVARVLDRGVMEDGQAYIVYEFIDGETLEEYFARRGSEINSRDIAKLVARIAGGVQAIHSAGLAHCDLKPSNILIDQEGNPKIVDMGIAQRQDVEFESSEQQEAVKPLGSLAFMSPEQYFMAPDATSPPADVYALGGILYWCLTGRCPNGDSADEIREAHASGLSNRAYKSATHNVDRSLASIIERALSIEKKDRYQTALAIADDLAAWIERKPIVWQQPSVLRRSVLAIRRHPVATALAALVLIAAGVGMSVVLHFQSVAKEQSRLAELKEAEAAFERDWKEQSKRFLESMVRVQSDLRASDFFGKQLNYLDWAENALSDEFMASKFGVMRIQEFRIELLDERLDKVEAAAGPRSFEAMILRPGIAWQHVLIGEPEKAIPLFDESILAWSNWLDCDDPWLLVLEVMRLTAEADAILPDPFEKGFVLDEAAAAAIASELDARVASLTKMSKGLATSGPVRLQAVLRLLELYSPGILDDEEKHLAWMNEYKAIQRIINR